MTLKSYIFILLLIFLSSSTSVGLLIFYMNPLNDLNMAFSLMGLGIFLAGTSLLAPLLFFIKKIYYRGDVHIQTMNASLRQAILCMLGILVMIALRIFHIDEARLIVTIWAIIGCIEVMIQAVD